MLVVGAGGFAKEILQIFHRKNEIDQLAFYDDVNLDTADFLFGKFPILKDESQARAFFIRNGLEFTIAIGNPYLRRKMYEKFNLLGGRLVSTISIKANIGSYEITIKEGCNILDNANISNGTAFGKGCIVYYNVIVAHDCIIGDFVELSPGATLLGGCKIGSFTQIGANATILPKIKIGNNSIIGAGALVNRDIPDNCLAVGVPAKVIKQIS